MKRQFTGVQEKLGILNGGTAYAVFDYAAQQPDELSFKAGQQFTVLRKGDENEREWWWSKLGDKEGYVPRNLLGVRKFNKTIYDQTTLMLVIICSFIQGSREMKKAYYHSFSQRHINPSGLFEKAFFSFN